MRRRWVLVAAAGAAALVSAGPLAVPSAAGTATAAVRAASPWGQAIEVPGLAALNKGHEALLNQLSCASADNCAAGGFYRDGRRHQQGFVVGMNKGHWGQAVKMPGRLNKGGNAAVSSVSCASAGNCGAGGDYETTGGSQGFVVSQKNGAWDSFMNVPGLRALNKGGNAEVSSASCPAAGHCVAGGSYWDAGRHFQAFVSQPGSAG